MTGTGDDDDDYMVAQTVKSLLLMLMIMVMMVMMVIMVMMMIAWWLKQGKLKDFCRESRRVSSRFYPPTKTCGAEGGTKS